MAVLVVEQLYTVQSVRLPSRVLGGIVVVKCMFVLLRTNTVAVRFKLELFDIDGAVAFVGMAMVGIIEAPTDCCILACDKVGIY